MNCGEMVTMVQNLFGDTSEAQITVPFIKSVLNAGQLDIAKKTDALERRATTAIGSGDNSYELPEDYIKIDAVLVDSRPMARFSQHDIEVLYETLDTSSGTPHSWYKYGRTIFFYPTPSSAVSEIEVRYTKRPTDLVNDADESDLPATMHEDIVRYALARCKELDENPEAALMIMAEYENRVNTSRDEIFDGHLDSYPSVRLLPGDYA